MRLLLYRYTFFITQYSTVITYLYLLIIDSAILTIYRAQNRVKLGVLIFHYHQYSVINIGIKGQECKYTLKI